MKYGRLVCCLTFFVGVIIGMHFPFQNLSEVKKVENANNSPIIMKVDGYNVIKAYNSDVFTIELQDKDGNIYQSDYVQQDLEDLVCQKGIHEYTYTLRNYDCSTPEKTLNAMIKELAIQSIQLIKEERI